MDDGPRRRVLVLAYFFPPLGGGGVQRTLKFVRYLEPLAWDATVISTRSGLYPARDSSLLNEVPPSTRVIRTSAFPIGHYLGIVLNRLRLRRTRAWVLWPDGGLGWAPFAFVSAMRAVRRDRPDVLFSTSAPYSAHLVALVVAKLTRLPWVADFRDDWAANALLPGQPRALASLTARAESAITSGARRVVVAADYFHLTGLQANDERRVEILNGVDEADIPNRAPSPPRDRFVLANVGTIYGSVDPSAALRALSELVSRNEIDGERIEVRLVGSIWEPTFEPPEGIRVVCTGYVEHRKAVAEMFAATALLFYRPSSSLAPSGKLFEYLASGRPLLCLADSDNLASRLVREWGAGVIADPQDETGIKRALLALWGRWQKNGLPDQEQVRRRTLESYSRRANAAKLAEVLEEARCG
jgi:glycosyltransferase involved in cell wall biosynthesis